MHEQLVDQGDSLEGNHDPPRVALSLNLRQVSTDSGKAMPSEYQVMDNVMTHPSMAPSNELGLYILD